MAAYTTFDIVEIAAQAMVTDARNDTAIATFPTLQTERWLVDRLTVIAARAGSAATNPVVGTTAFVYLDNASPLNQRLATDPGRGDYNVWEAQGSPLLVPQGKTLVVAWYGSNPGGFLFGFWTFTAIVQVQRQDRGQNQAPQLAAV